MFRLASIVVLVSTALASAQTSIPTTGPAKAALGREIAHLARVEARLMKHPRLAQSAYTRLELAIARRFVDRLKTGGGEGDKELEWKLLQADEVGQVLNHTEATIDAIEAGKLPADGLGAVPIPIGGAVKIDDGVFVTDTILAPGDTPKSRPFYFGGYGHFQSIVNDLPNFGELGVTLVQDGRNGPAQGLAQDRTLTPAGKEIADMLATAAKSNVKVDILTSPHYFPAWGAAEAPDMQNGWPYHNVDHPKAREIIEKWLSLVAEQNKNAPALFSYCLSNEPMYGNSGRDPHSAPAWHAFLKERHKTIDALNKIYEKNYKRFEEVPAGGWDESDIGRRHAYDWVCFNDRNFAGWHKWMGDVLKKHDPRALTHAKIMVFFTLDHNQAGAGIDPEQFCLATDIAGCDAYAQMIAGVGPLDETTAKEYAYHWQVQQLCYDLLHSFRNQPVFNSENHPIENANGAYRYPAAQSRAVIWQGGLHHQGATTTWVWEEETSHPSLLHSIYFRPAYIWGHQRALLDLNRLSEEVTAINRAEPTVAILYSPASRFWEPDYARSVRTIYTALTFLGHNITFVSERQLIEGQIPDVRAIVLPRVTHISNAAHNVLDRSPVRKVAAGDCFKFDEYHVQRTQIDSQVSLDSEQAAHADLHKLLGPSPAKLQAWGVEHRVIKHGDELLVPLINHLKKPQTISISIDRAEAEAIDLLSHQVVSLKELQLQPMEPMLLQISWR